MNTYRQASASPRLSHTPLASRSSRRPSRHLPARRPGSLLGLLGALLCGALLASPPSRAVAQEAAPSPAASAQASADTDAQQDRAASFRTVDGAQAEDVPGGLMLVGAYGLVALLLLIFLLRQAMQLRDLSTRMETLRAEIEREEQRHARGAS